MRRGLMAVGGACGERRGVQHDRRQHPGVRDVRRIRSGPACDAGRSDSSARNRRDCCRPSGGPAASGPSFFGSDLSRAGPSRFPGRPGAARRRAVALPWRPGRAGQGRGLDAGRRSDAMSTEYLKIAGGTVYDPANGIDGEVRDIWIAGGKIVEPPVDPEIQAGPGDRRPRAGRHARRRRHALPHRRAEGQHRAEDVPRAEAARRAGPPHAHARAAARWGACPARSPPATSTPGWATRRPSTPPFRPSPPGTLTRNSRTRPASTRASSCLMGNNHYLMRSIQQGEPEKVKAFVGWLLGRDEGVRRQDRQSRRRRGLEEPAGGQRRRPRLGRRPLRSDAAADHHGRSRRRSTSCSCRTRCTSTPTTSACPATGRRRSRP